MRACIYAWLVYVLNYIIEKKNLRMDRKYYDAYTSTTTTLLSCNFDETLFLNDRGISSEILLILFRDFGL